MARPHIEFFQAQAITWHILGNQSARPGAQEKVLSRDTETSASSSIIRYPKGWVLEQPHCLKSDEEFFVLTGTLVINNISYSKGDYAYLPAGFQRTKMQAVQETDILTYFEGPANLVAVSEPVNFYSDAKLITRVPTEKVEWGSATDQNVAGPGVRRLGLRKDSTTGDTTWLLEVNEIGMGKDVNRLETHPVVEEVFILSGEMHMPMGVLKRGAYFWRPPYIPHGPVGTRSGALGIFRCKGGSLKTEWSDDLYPVQWNAPYNPVLPEDLKSGLRKSYDETLFY
ncbi:MAG: cupin domain-containing protein [Rhodospirillaceae bacterium]